jgi:hypothetical protein
MKNLINIDLPNKVSDLLHYTINKLINLDKENNKILYSKKNILVSITPITPPNTPKYI